MKKHCFFFFFFLAHALAADVCVHAQERPTRFCRPEPPEEPMARWHSDNRLGRPPVRDTRTQHGHSTHLRLWRQSTLLGTYHFCFTQFRPLSFSRRREEGGEGRGEGGGRSSIFSLCYCTYDACQSRAESTRKKRPFSRYVFPKLID
jgi:hypothetical protein